MRENSARFRVAMILCAASSLLIGCFDMGDRVASAPTSPTPNPPPPPPPNTNSAPTISGNPPPAVIVGDSYSFTPTASDPDGDVLTFSILNQPTWANFDTSTGTLSGVAVQGSEGTYVNIQITVSDGALSASTPQFSVDVLQAALGSATLSWVPPTQNEDGTPLTDLAGYKIYYGNQTGNYSTEVQIDNPGIVTYVVEDLTPNTYFFASTALNSSGVESAFSNEAVKVIN